MRVTGLNRRIELIAELKYIFVTDGYHFVRHLLLILHLAANGGAKIHLTTQRRLISIFSNISEKHTLALPCTHKHTTHTHTHARTQI